MELALNSLMSHLTPVVGQGGGGGRSVDSGKSLEELFYTPQVWGVGFTVTCLQNFCSNLWFMGFLELSASEESDPVCPQLPKVELAVLGGFRSRGVLRGPD